MSSSDLALPMIRTARTRRPRSLDDHRDRLLLLMVLPAVLLIAVLVAYPLYVMADIALHDVKLFQVMQHVDRPATLRNFERVLSDPRVGQALQVSALYVAGTTALAFLWGLATALLLNRPFRGRRLVRIAIVSPWAVASVVASLVWMFLLDAQAGIVMHALTAAGLLDQPINLLMSPVWALVTVVLVSAWKGYPFFTIMLLAGLQAVPQDSLDAARVDGAGGIRRFFWVTLPSLRPVIAVSVSLSLLSAFREVETIMVLTGGGPARTTETLALSIYNRTFQYFEVGRASALGVIVFAISLLLVLASLRTFLPKEAQR